MTPPKRDKSQSSAQLGAALLAARTDLCAANLIALVDSQTLRAASRAVDLHKIIEGKLTTYAGLLQRKIDQQAATIQTMTAEVVAARNGRALEKKKAKDAYCSRCRGRMDGKAIETVKVTIGELMAVKNKVDTITTDKVN